MSAKMREFFGYVKDKTCEKFITLEKKEYNDGEGHRSKPDLDEALKEADSAKKKEDETYAKPPPDSEKFTFPPSLYKTLTSRILRLKGITRFGIRSIRGNNCV